MRDLYVFGAGVQGRVVADLVRWQFAGLYHLAGFFDDGKVPGGEIPFAGRVLGSVEDAESLLPADAAVFVALGSRHRAKALQLIRDLRDSGFAPVRLVPPAAQVSPSARLGDNALVMPGALVGAGVTAGDLLWVHGNAAVEHDVHLGSGVLVGPGVAVASGARIGHGVLLGAGTVVSNSVVLGDGVLVGAGAVAVRDLPAHTVCFGNPAVPRRPTRAGDEAILAADLAALSLPPAGGA